MLLLPRPLALSCSFKTKPLAGDTQHTGDKKRKTSYGLVCLLVLQAWLEKRTIVLAGKIAIRN